MRTSLRRCLAGFAGGLLAAATVAPGLVAAAETVEVGNAEEAWYLQEREPLSNTPEGDPTCDSPLGCNAAGNVTRPKAYPDNTLHVSVNAGRPDTQTYFTFDLSQAPFGATVTGGTVTLPVAPDNVRGGNYRPEAADMVACFVTGFVVSAEGESFDARPEFDEDTCVPVTLVEGSEETGQLVYTFDLAAFAERWGAGESNSGVTVLANPEITPGDPEATWGVTFNGARREGENLRFITSRLELDLSAAGGAFDDLGPGGGTGGADSDAAGGFADDGGDTSSGSSGNFSGGGFGSSDDGLSGDPQFQDPQAAEAGTSDVPPIEEGAFAGGAAEPQVAESQPQAQAAPQAPVTSTPPGLWLLSLLGLSLAGALGYSLSQPVELPPEREGAVSKLMRTRRGEAA